MRLFTALTVLCLSCGGTEQVEDIEGDQPGECTDGADNDRDGKFDCDDSDCSGSPDCKTQAKSGSTAATEKPIQAKTSSQYPGTRQGAERLLKDMISKKIDFTYLRPNPEDYTAAFDAETAEVMKLAYEPMWKSGVQVKMKDHQSEVIFWSATTEELLLKTGDASNFPGGYTQHGVAEKMKPNLTWYRFKFVEPGETIGTAYDGLVFVNGHWTIFPKPWRALK